LLSRRAGFDDDDTMSFDIYLQDFIVGGSSGIDVGTSVDGGGVVTGVTPTTVTVEQPQIAT
jgi:hypothetical protein